MRFIFSQAQTFCKSFKEGQLLEEISENELKRNDEAMDVPSRAGVTALSTARMANRF